MRRPGAYDCDAYYLMYTDRVPEEDVIGVLEREIVGTRALLESFGEERAEHRYAEGKWSVKEVVNHVIDVERTFALRALAFARCDSAPLPSFDQDEYSRHARCERRTLADLSAELQTVRAASVSLFRSFDETDWNARGVASGYEFSVCALPFIVAGHERHHAEVLRKRYA